jgi:hypothetical protein
MKNRLFYNTIVIVLIVIASISIFLMYKTLDYNDYTLDVVALKEVLTPKKETLAILIEQENGDYLESESNSWPTDDYVYNPTKSGCVDKDGNEINEALSFDTNTNKASIRTIKSLQCYLYFDIKSVPTVTSATISSLDNEISTRITNITFDQVVNVSHYYLVINNVTLEYDGLNMTPNNTEDIPCYEGDTQYSFEVYAVTTNGVTTNSYNGTITSSNEMAPCFSGDRGID